MIVYVKVLNFPDAIYHIGVTSVQNRLCLNVLISKISKPSNSSKVVRVAIKLNSGYAGPLGGVRL